jgi:hypothetical protein
MTTKKDRDDKAAADAAKKDQDFARMHTVRDPHIKDPNVDVTGQSVNPPPVPDEQPVTYLDENTVRAERPRNADELDHQSDGQSFDREIGRDNDTDRDEVRDAVTRKP